MEKLSSVVAIAILTVGTTGMCGAEDVEAAWEKYFVKH